MPITLNRPDIEWVTIRGADLVSGLTLYRAPTGHKNDLDTNRLAERTGQCSNGLHFGNACYDKISTWWAPVRRHALEVRRMKK